MITTRTLRRAGFDRGIGGDAHRQTARRGSGDFSTSPSCCSGVSSDLAAVVAAASRHDERRPRAHGEAARLHLHLDAALAAGAIGVGRLEAEQVIAGQLAAQSIERGPRRRR